MKNRHWIWCLLFPLAFSLQGQHLKHFDGMYVGLAGGQQHLFGGALLDGIDVLAERSSWVWEGALAYRKQLLSNRVVVGVELVFGLTNGQLRQIDSRSQVEVDYKNETQTAIGVSLGWVPDLPRKTLVFVFAQRLRRQFDISFNSLDGMHHTQLDTQNFDNFGLGAEYSLRKRWNLRASLSKSVVDFGDLETSLELNNPLNYSLGITFQLF